MNKNVFIGFVVVIAVGIGVVTTGIINNKDKTQPTTTSTQTVDNDADDQPALQPATTNTTTKEPAATITYTDEGFSPTKLSVKSGDVVRVINNSPHALQFSSDPHPIHTKDKDLNQRTLLPGQSQTFDVTQKGTFGFHDHIDATKTGTIVIE